MIRCAVSQSHESSPEINMMMLNRLIRGMPTWAWIAATGVLLASDSCNAFTGGVELHASAAGRVFSPFAGAWHTGSQRSVGPIGGRANLVMGLQTKKKVGRKTGMAASRSTKARVQADDFAAVSTGASSDFLDDVLIGEGLLGMTLDKPGFAYGPAYGPSHDRSWALEAAMMSSMRRTLNDDPDSEDTLRQASIRRPSTGSMPGSGGGHAAASHRLSLMRGGVEEPLCGCLAENLFRLMRIRLRGGQPELKGLLTEVQTRPVGGPVLTLLSDDGSFVTASAMDVEEVILCTVGGCSESAARAHLMARGGPAHALSDVCLSMMRGMSASLGRQVLVQNLRHVIVGFSGCRAVWSDFLGEGDSMDGEGLARWINGGSSWLVKVMSESDRLRGVDGGRWVPVSWVLPMSEYDLQVYSTYRHETLPSSEYDLQRHDPLLLKTYRQQQSAYTHDDLALVG